MNGQLAAYKKLATVTTSGVCFQQCMPVNSEIQLLLHPLFGLSSALKAGVKSFRL